jgi:dihydrofolate reductase
VGGGEIYRQSLALADMLYATVVHTQIEGADTWFPEYLDQFTEVERDDHPADERHAFAYSFVRLEKK